MAKDTTGDINRATGSGALNANAGGARNTADGWTTLLRSAGNDNTALGAAALTANTTGNSNLALGSGAGKNLTTGSNDVDIANYGAAGDDQHRQRRQADPGSRSSFGPLESARWKRSLSRANAR